MSLEAFEGRELEAYWMDPVTGLCTYAGGITGGGEALFAPPEREDGTDCVLVLLAEE